MRIFILLLATICLPAAAAELKKFDMDELSKHATPKDCWVVIKNKVYDLTAYFPKHPAPDAVLAKYCGKNADEGWDTKDKKSPHSRAAARLLKRYEIGEFSK
jgi:cytochrome b involved in lipid metabolism